MGSITHQDVLTNRTNKAPGETRAPTSHEGDQAVVSRKFTFSAAHKLPGHPKCGRWHGHNYTIEVRVRGPIKPDGMVIDFSDLKKAFQPIMDRYDHNCLNDFPELSPPTAEKMALAIFHELTGHLKNHWPTYVLNIRVWETDDCYAEVGQ